MKLSQIECFIAVAQAGHFGRGAERIHRSQPPVSRQIRLLEEELGVQLLERQGGQVTLTVAGRAFLLQAERGMRQLHEAVRMARLAGQPPQAKLRIGTTASVMLGTFAALLARFQVMHPDGVFELVTADKTSQMAMLADGRIDVAVVRSLPDLPGTQVVRLLNEPISAAVNANHELATHSQIDLHILATHRLIVYRGRSVHSVANLLIELCQRAGFQPLIEAETDDMQSAAFMASLSSGVALVAASLQNMNTPNLVYRPVLLDGEPVTMPLYLVVREADASDGVQRIVRFVTDQG